ncbi:hypothetical protein SAMN05421823_102365 [Catalinimonas alkaloidigena]|uniref:Uncharacterized protein n=1 Tax=Catalinimonas alkaloidigena TaxID=1075417 RepID=A0A1G9ANR0_9BACT|nr:hypothetical protein SAMN05421823_102365 [Catalinimonas alkaloidigena]
MKPGTIGRIRNKSALCVFMYEIGTQTVMVGLFNKPASE